MSRVVSPVPAMAARLIVGRNGSADPAQRCQRLGVLDGERLRVPALSEAGPPHQSLQPAGAGHTGGERAGRLQVSEQRSGG